MKVFYIIIACALLLGQDAIAQKVKYRPLDFNRPFTCNLEIERNAFQNEVHDAIDKKNKSEWYVVSDQNDNPVYESKNVGSKVMARLKFRDICYITSDNPGWLKVAKEINGTYEEIGWMPKSNVLQWNSCLLDPVTNMYIKAFSIGISRLTDHGSNTLYSGPETKDSIGTVSLRDFYFVYKIHYADNGEPLRYLLCTDNFISKELGTDLKGWVDARGLQKWTSRLALEPNSIEEAIDERRANPNYHIEGFIAKGISKLVTNGTMSRIDPNKVVWSSDIADSTNGDAVNSESYSLLIGKHKRFPIISNYENCYETAALGTLFNLSNNDTPNSLQFTETSLNTVKVALNRNNERILKPEELKAKVEAIGDTSFFQKVYFAKKQPNQVYDPFSLVVFMTHNDLEEYVKHISILSHYLDLSPDLAREQMQKFLQELGKQFTGGEDMNIINDLEIEDILNLFLGVEKEGYKGLVNLKETFGCKLKYLDNSLKCKDEDIQRFSESIISATQKLKSILDDKTVYEYKYKSNGNKWYYWIPVEYLY